MTRRPARARRRHGRLRLHGRGPLAGLAHRRRVLRPAAAARTWPCSCGRDAGRAWPRRPTGSAGRPPRPTGGALLERDDIDLVDICTPGDTHAEIAIAALEAGKHVLCEKPLANTVAEAEAMAAAAERAAGRGVRSMVGFTYRRVPAIALARQLVAEGRIGEIRHVRAQYLQDWLVDPEFAADLAAAEGARPAPARSATSARTSSTSPSTSPGDRLTGVSALTETFVTERPLPAGVDAALGRRPAGPATRRRSTVDDAALFLGRFAGGALGVVRGHPVRDRPQERDPARDQRLAAAASPSTSRT